MHTSVCPSMDHELSLTSIHHRVLDPTLAKRWTTRSPDSIRLGRPCPFVPGRPKLFRSFYPSLSQRVHKSGACVTCAYLDASTASWCAELAPPSPLELARASPLLSPSALLRRRVFISPLVLVALLRFQFLQLQLISSERTVARSRRGFAGAE